MSLAWAEVRELVASLEARIGAEQRERDKARAAFREYRGRLLLDSSLRYGPLRRRLDEEFEARFPWLKEGEEGRAQCAVRGASEGGTAGNPPPSSPRTAHRAPRTGAERP